MRKLATITPIAKRISTAVYAAKKSTPSLIMSIKNGIGMKRLTISRTNMITKNIAMGARDERKGK